MDQRQTTGRAEENVTVETTIGDLIEAITEIALEAGKTEEEGYRLASFTIEKILRDKRRKEFES